MDFKAIRAGLKLVWVTVFVTLSVSVTQAQMTCNQAYRELKIKSIYRDTFEAIQDLDRAIAEMGILLARPQEVTSLEVMAHVLTVSLRVQEYFQQAGIRFEQDLHSIDIPKLKDAQNFKMTYPIFRMYGSRSGDQFARMMYGVQVHPKLQEHPPVFAFDPFYLINFGKGGMRGHFDPIAKAVVIGPHVLSMDLAGISTVFRHELHHYLESVKVERGEMSLQRVLMADPGEASGKSYGDKVSVDEVETHIRDLRAGSNQNRVAKIDSHLETRVEPEYRAAIRSERLHMQGHEKQSISTVINGAQEALPVVLELARKKEWKEFGVEEATGGVLAVFQTPATDYKLVGINLKGLVTEKSSSEQVREAVIKVLNWTKNRLDQVDNELQKYKTEEK